MKTKKEKLLALFARNPEMSIEDAMRRTGASRPLTYRARTEARDQFYHSEIEKALATKRFLREAGEKQITQELTSEEPKKLVSIVDTLTARGDKYGPFIGHAEISRALKNVIHYYAVERKGSFQNIDADMAEALDMIAHKIARIINGDHNYADSWVDIAGYAKLVADRLQGVTR